MSKQKIRAELIEARKMLPASEVDLKSRIITDKFLELVDWSSVRSLCMYKSVSSLKEVETSQLFLNLTDKHPEICVAVIEPKISAKVPTEKFDLILVPVVGFDKKLNRLGMGGGFYDRFLTRQPQALKIGLAYSLSFIKEDVDWEPHDVALDIIITEKGIIVKRESNSHKNQAN